MIGQIDMHAVRYLEAGLLCIVFDKLLVKAGPITLMHTVPRAKVLGISHAGMTQ